MPGLKLMRRLQATAGYRLQVTDYWFYTTSQHDPVVCSLSSVPRRYRFDEALENAVENNFTAKTPRAQKTYSKDKIHPKRGSRNSNFQRKDAKTQRKGRVLNSISYDQGLHQTDESCF